MAFVELACRVNDGFASAPVSSLNAKFVLLMRNVVVQLFPGSLCLLPLRPGMR